MATVDQDLRFELQERNQDRKRLHDQLGQENRGGLSLEQADRLKLFFKRRKPSEVLAMSDQEKRDYDAERRKAVREMTEAQARAHEALRKRRVVEGYEAGLDRVIAKFRRNKKRDMRNVSSMSLLSPTESTAQILSCLSCH